MNIKIKNFGPISNADIDLKPLTIFAGPNMSGKSYAATFIHSINKSKLSKSDNKDERFFFSGNITNIANIRLIKKQIPILKNLIPRFKNKGAIDIPYNFKMTLSKVAYKILIEQNLREELSLQFLSPIRNLISFGKRQFESTIQIDSQRLSFKYANNGIEITNFPKSDLMLSIEIVKLGKHRNQYKIESNISLSISGTFVGDSIPYESILFHFFDICMYGVQKKIKLGASISYLLPAARSGILEGQKVIVSNIIRNIPSVAMGKSEIPRLSGVVSDLIYLIESYSAIKSPFYELASKAEIELINGEIILIKEGKFALSEIAFNLNGRIIPLHMASSTVSELAPIFLFVKHVISKDSLLIIEEPEAHLHPKNQRILAKFLVRLIRAGVKILITTHSDFLISQLNAFMLLSKVSGNQRQKKYHYDKNDYLKFDEVGAYVFSYDRKSKGYRTAPVEISQEDGISQEEFVRIHESLYEESFKLRNQ